MEFFKSATGTEGDMAEDNQLLQTIRIPKNLLFLTDRLPQANYERMPTIKKNHSFQNNGLPEIRKTNSKQKFLKEKQEKVERIERVDLKEIKEVRVLTENSPILSNKQLQVNIPTEESPKKIESPKKHQLNSPSIGDEEKKKSKIMINELDKSIDYDKSPINNIKVIRNNTLTEETNSPSVEKESKKQATYKNNEIKLPAIKTIVNIEKYEQLSPRKK